MADSMVVIALVWKNGPVSAASISGGVLKVPLPYESSAPSPSASKLNDVTPGPPKPPSKGMPSVFRSATRERSTPVLQFRLHAAATFAPALLWQPMQRLAGVRNARRPV